MTKVQLAIGGIILSLLMTGTGFGFFDELLKSLPKQQQPKASQEQGNEQEQPNFIDGFGAIFGAKKKELDLIKKGLGVVQALEPIGEEEEITLGQAVAVEAFSRFGGEYQNEGMTRYINLVGKTIAEVSDRPNLNFHFAILNSQEQNAFAAPGGYIFVTIGLLQTLRNEAELAGVLAHEVAHITQKHMLETIRRGALLSNVSDLSMTALNQDPQMFSGVIDEITDKLFTKGMDKEKEFDADVFGLEFAYRAGYNPTGLRDYLRTLKSQEGHAQSRFFTTHPSTSDRIGRIERKLGEYTDGNSWPVLTKRFRQFVPSA